MLEKTLALHIEFQVSTNRADRNPRLRGAYVDVYEIVTAEEHVIGRQSTLACYNGLKRAESSETRRRAECVCSSTGIAML